MYKKLLLCFLITVSCVIVKAQGSISGLLRDEDKSEALSLATVSVYRAADTSLITYRLSDSKGAFKVTGLPLDVPCRVVVTFSGYATWRREFTLTDSAKDLNMDTVKLIPLAGNLEEVVIIAERPPVQVRKDTVEFNANSFKTLPNAVVEDLLKKLPGVQVDKDGNIMVGGKPVNKILVDGKSFFGNDPKMASRNLPAHTIDKIQVTDDMEELNASGDDNKNNVGKVINLTFKKGYKKGVFGKAYAGAGTDKRYEAGAIANVFRDTLQLSLLGYANNLNKPGFTGSDLLNTGGLSRSSNLSGSRSMSMNNSPAGSSVSINGINFGGLSSLGGVSASSGGGFNLNHSPNDKKSFYLQYFYGYVDTDAKTRSDNRTTYGDTVLSRITANQTDVYSRTHIANIGFKLKPDTVTTWSGELSYTDGRQANIIATDQTAYTTYHPALNSGTYYNYKLNNSRYARAGSDLTILSRSKKGRRFSANQLVQYNARTNDYTTDARLKFYYPTVYDSLMHQLRLEEAPQFNVLGGANYSEPLSKIFTLTAQARYEYEKLKNDIATYDLAPNPKLRLASLSNGFSRNTHKAYISTGIRWKYKDLSIRPAIKLQTQHFHTEYTMLADPLVQNQNNILPQLSINYKELNIEYNRDVNLPGYQYFIAVRDNTNPYIIQSGNTSMLPTITDGISAYYNKYDTKTNINIWSWANASFVKNDIIQSTRLGSDGVQVITPMNAGKATRYMANFGITKDYKKRPEFTLTWNIGGYIQYNNNLFVYNDISSRQKTFNNNYWGFINLNWNDKFEFNTNFGVGLRSTSNTNSYFKKFTSASQSVGIEVIDRHIKRFIFESQLNYNFNNAIEDPKYRNYWLWKAAVNYTMFKDERGILKFSVFDILNQITDASITTQQNQVTFRQRNTLGRYAMLTFTYNLFAAGAKKKVGGQWNLW